MHTITIRGTDFNPNKERPESFGHDLGQSGGDLGYTHADTAKLAVQSPHTHQVSPGTPRNHLGSCRAHGGFDSAAEEQQFQCWLEEISQAQEPEAEEEPMSVGWSLNYED